MALHAREELGRLGEYQLDLLSPKDDINVDDILGKNVTVKLALPDDSTRYFNGYVTRFAQGGTLRPLHALLTPSCGSWLWFLTRTTDCRIFQEMTVPDIVKKVFADHRHRRLQVRADRHLSQVDLLRAVPRDRLQLRQPAARARGDLLLLRSTPTGTTRWC